ncbi:MAG: PBP1A family penicillin-binding protein [Candidatus Choladocola sp.]|nr:PBP1A family penicillin-binding protein [Candidatus Choladocola sp.]
MENKFSFSWRKIAAAAGIILAALFLLLAGTVWYLIASSPDIDSITVSPTESATYICSQDGTYLRRLTLASSNRDIVSLEEIPDSLQKAIIAIEDERFYEHGGIDLKGIARAFWTGLTTGSFSEGASTITQQLIKNNVFTEWTRENSFADRFRRKIQEQYLALQLEDRISKEEILEDYLNTVNFGSGCYGVQAASRRYFGKNVSELTLSESAVLAAIPQNPTGNNPSVHPEANRKRQTLILNYMEQQGYITADQRREAQTDDVWSRIRVSDDLSGEETAYSYYEDALIDQVTDYLTEEKGYSSEQAYRAVYSGGLRIYTAQDPALQQICDEEFRNPANFPEGTQYGVDYALSVSDENGAVTHYGSETLRTWIRQNRNSSFDLICSSADEAQSYTDDFRTYILSSGSSSLTVLGERLTLSPQPQASLVLMDQHTGFIRAIVGGRGEKTASLTLNRATETTRQPGSTFKILAAYAPALDSCGQTLATTYINEPYRYENGTPVSNWDISDYSGAVTVREAITRSINVVAVKCITEISPRTGFEYARKFGISTLYESYESENGTSSDVIQPLALGGITQGVTNLELCSAYAAIANGGLSCEPRFFTKIVDRHGSVIVDYTNWTEQAASAAETVSDETVSPRRVISRETAFLLTDAMRDVVSSPSGTACGTISAAGQPVAGKTGTTSSYKDIWFVGYTPYYTCCVWGGYDNNQDLPSGSTGHTYNRLLWSSVMNRVHENLPAADFAVPDSVTRVTLCAKTHLAAVPDGCPDTYTEYFAAGTEPQQCNVHEPLPETEPILIYQDFLDQLLPETETLTEPETEAESLSEDDSESETESPSPEVSPEESESHPEMESQWESEQPDTTSLEDLINRLSGSGSSTDGRLFSVY